MDLMVSVWMVCYNIMYTIDALLQYMKDKLLYMYMYGNGLHCVY